MTDLVMMLVERFQVRLTFRVEQLVRPYSSCSHNQHYPQIRWPLIRRKIRWETSRCRSQGGRSVKMLRNDHLLLVLQFEVYYLDGAQE